VNDKISQTSIIPAIGMAFDSEDSAYDMYNYYAGKIGFSIRKSTTRHRSDGTIYQKHLVCSSEGHAKDDSSSKGMTRIGCGARIQFSVSKEGVWMVQKVVFEHNHYLASPNKTKNLRSQRRVTEADRKLIG
jgi:zinc finger SWIM domain-containing protein 3